MFEDVTNRPSRWRAFWPDVSDGPGAQEAIRLAVWFAYLAGGLAVVATLASIVAGTNVLANLFNVAFFGVVVFGLRRGWRTVAVAGTALLGLGLIDTALQGGFPGVVSPFVMAGMVNGVRGTFAANRLRRTSLSNEPEASKNSAANEIP
jgi:hypothetical protein